jgi:probable F420-dependent oxidoreductase
VGVEFGVVIPTWGDYGEPRTIRRLILAAEELGYSTAWFGDHLLLPDYATALSPANWYEALTCCFVGMGLTTRLRFGTDVLVLPYRDPRPLAKMAATADQLSGGRLTLGVGVGFLRGEFEALGAPDLAERGAVSDEYVRVLRLLWESEGPLSFDGKYVRFESAHAVPRPAQRPLPLWVGGNGRRAQRRAAELGDGWHPLFPSADDYARGRKAIAELRDGRDLEDFTFSYSCSETRVLASGEARAEPHTYSDMGDLPDDYTYVPDVPRTADGRAYFVGTAAQVAGDLQALAAAGVQHFALRFWSGDPDFGPDRVLEQMRRFASDVAPRLR